MWHEKFPKSITIKAGWHQSFCGSFLKQALCIATAALLLTALQTTYISWKGYHMFLWSRKPYFSFSRIISYNIFRRFLVHDLIFTVFSPLIEWVLTGENAAWFSWSGIWIHSLLSRFCLSQIQNLVNKTI